MAVLDERRFTPISYSRDELVAEAECLTDTEVASWLAAQSDDTFGEIMNETNRLIWFGASYLGSLEAAMRSAFVAANPCARRSAKSSLYVAIASSAGRRRPDCCRRPGVGYSGLVQP